MFSGGTRDVLQKGAILPSTHIHLAPQSPRSTSFSSLVSPASVVVLAIKHIWIDSQLWIKIHQAQSRSLLWCLVLVLAEGWERVRAVSRERGRGSLWLLSWLVLAEGAHGHSVCPGWSQHTQPAGSIQKSLVSPSWLSMPQLLCLCRDLYWSSTEVPFSRKLFPCWHQLTRTALVYIGNENWNF